MDITPFTLDVPQGDVDDLRARLERTRWAPELDNDDWSYGVNGTYLRELVTYWQHDFDWRAQEERINRFPHFRTTIDGVRSTSSTSGATARTPFPSS